MMRKIEIERTIHTSAARLWLATGVVVVLVCAAAWGAEGARIELRGEVELSGGEVRLGDIAKIDGQGGERLGEVVVGKFDSEKGAGRIGRDEVRKALDDAGVNWGMHVLGGAVAVEMRRPVVAAVRVGRGGVGDGSGGGSFARANVYGEISIDDVRGDDAVRGGRTVRDVLVDYVMGDLGVRDAGDVEIKFEDSDAGALGRYVGTDRYEVRPMTTDLLGRAPVRVTRYVGGEPVGDERFVMSVRLRKEVAVISRPIGRGQLITGSDVELREVWLESGGDRFEGVSGLVGQRAGGAMREGWVLDTGDVRPPTVVKRRDMVRVRCISGGLVVTMTCRAKDEGAVGELITVRNERGREEFSARVTGPGAAVMVGLGGGEVVALSEEVQR